MVSPLVPGVRVLDLATLGVDGMIGAACDPNDPDSCEVPGAVADATATPTVEDAR